MATAAYAEGDAWLDALRDYLAGNAQAFDAGMAEIPGLRSMRLESTYLSWVDFRGTGMEQAEILRRLRDDARIAASPGPQFGGGGRLDAVQHRHAAGAHRRGGGAAPGAFGDLQ